MLNQKGVLLVMVVYGRRVVKDETHFILECPLYAEDREQFEKKMEIEPGLVDKEIQHEAGHGS